LAQKKRKKKERKGDNTAGNLISGNVLTLLAVGGVAEVAVFHVLVT
jgi:hypothetical protein